MRAVLMTIAFGMTLTARAFPDMIRHGYVNCMSCHVSPNGGGALTAYGRELSKEVLSTWSSEHEHLLFQGLLAQEDLPAWVNTLGGDFRGLQIHREDRYQRSGRFIPMQADLEAGLRYRAFKLNATVGTVKEDDEVRVALRKIYLAAQLAPGQQLRGGKFTPTYGLNIAEHTSFIKQDLGLGLKSESWNLEYSWMNEDWNYFATVAFPAQETARSNQEHRYLQQLAYNIASRYKLGVQHMLTASLAGNQQSYGVHALLGFSEQLYALAELNRVQTWPSSVAKETQGQIDYVKFGFEVFQGFHVQLLRESHQTDVEADLSQKNLWGSALVWYPRPHWEFQLAWNKVQQRSLSQDWNDMAWLLIHYYL